MEKPCYRIMANPANKLANTTPRPYSWPNSNAIALAAATLFAVPVADDPNPWYTALVPVPELDPVGLPVAPVVDVVDDALTRVGFWAPQGLFWLQAAWQVEDPLQLLTQS